MANLFDRLKETFTLQASDNSKNASPDIKKELTPETDVTRENVETPQARQGLVSAYAVNKQDGGKTSEVKICSSARSDDASKMKTDSQFIIPKRKRDESDILVDLMINSREFQYEILPAIVKSYRNSQSAEKFKYTKVQSVHNRDLLKLYLEKRKELRNSGYSDKESGDCVAFLCVEDEELMFKICRDGVPIGNYPRSCLGHPMMGVQLCKHADIIKPVPLQPNDTGYLILFKIIKGRIKSVAESISENPLEPTPHFDCHVSSNVPDTSASYQSLFESSQVYMYEYGEEEVVQYPRNVCPVAVVSFVYEKDSRDPRTNSPRVHQSLSRGGSLAGGSVRDGEQEFVVWSGSLTIKGLYACSVEMTSSAAFVKPAVLGSQINISSKLSVKQVQQKYLRNVSGIRRSSEGYWNGYYVNACELRPLAPEGRSHFQRVMNYLGKHNAIAVQKLEKDVTLLMLTQSELTYQLGLSRPHQYPVLLYCLFLSRTSARKRLSNPAGISKEADKTNTSPAKPPQPPMPSSLPPASPRSEDPLRTHQSSSSPFLPPSSPQHSIPPSPMLDYQRSPSSNIVSWPQNLPFGSPRNPLVPHSTPPPSPANYPGAPVPHTPPYRMPPSPQTTHPLAPNSPFHSPYRGPEFCGSSPQRRISREGQQGYSCPLESKSAMSFNPPNTFQGGPNFDAQYPPRPNFLSQSPYKPPHHPGDIGFQGPMPHFRNNAGFGGPRFPDPNWNSTQGNAFQGRFDPNRSPRIPGPTFENSGTSNPLLNTPPHLKLHNMSNDVFNSPNKPAWSQSGPYGAPPLDRGNVQQNVQTTMHRSDPRLSKIVSPKVNPVAPMPRGSTSDTHGSPSQGMISPGAVEFPSSKLSPISHPSPQQIPVVAPPGTPPQTKASHIPPPPIVQLPEPPIPSRVTTIPESFDGGFFFKPPSSSLLQLDKVKKVFEEQNVAQEIQQRAKEAIKRHLLVRSRTESKKTQSLKAGKIEVKQTGKDLEKEVAESAEDMKQLLESSLEPKLTAKKKVEQLKKKEKGKHEVKEKYRMKEKGLGEKLKAKGKYEIMQKDKVGSVEPGVNKKIQEPETSQTESLLKLKISEPETFKLDSLEDIARMRKITEEEIKRESERQESMDDMDLDDDPLEKINRRNSKDEDPAEKISIKNNKNPAEKPESKDEEPVDKVSKKSKKRPKERDALDEVKDLSDTDELLSKKAKIDTASDMKDFLNLSLNENDPSLESTPLRVDLVPKKRLEKRIVDGKMEKDKKAKTQYYNICEEISGIAGERVKIENVIEGEKPTRTVEINDPSYNDISAIEKSKSFSNVKGSVTKLKLDDNPEGLVSEKGTSAIRKDQKPNTSSKSDSGKMEGETADQSGRWDNPLKKKKRTDSESDGERKIENKKGKIIIIKEIRMIRVSSDGSEIKSPDKEPETKEKLTESPESPVHTPVEEDLKVVDLQEVDPKVVKIKMEEPEEREQKKEYRREKESVKQKEKDYRQKEDKSKRRDWEERRDDNRRKDKNERKEKSKGREGGKEKEKSSDLKSRKKAEDSRKHLVLYSDTESESSRSHSSSMRSRRSETPNSDDGKDSVPRYTRIYPDFKPGRPKLPKAASSTKTASSSQGRQEPARKPGDQRRGNLFHKSKHQQDSKAYPYKTGKAGISKMTDIQVKGKVRSLVQSRKDFRAHQAIIEGIITSAKVPLKKIPKIKKKPITTSTSSPKHESTLSSQELKTDKELNLKGTETQQEESRETTATDETEEEEHSMEIDNAELNGEAEFVLMKEEEVNSLEVGKQAMTTETKNESSMNDGHLRKTPPLENTMTVFSEIPQETSSVGRSSTILSLGESVTISSEIPAEAKETSSSGENISDSSKITNEKFTAANNESVLSKSVMVIGHPKTADRTEEDFSSEQSEEVPLSTKLGKENESQELDEEKHSTEIETKDEQCSTEFGSKETNFQQDSVDKTVNPGIKKTTFKKKSRKMETDLRNVMNSFISIQSGKVTEKSVDICSEQKQLGANMLQPEILGCDENSKESRTDEAHQQLEDLLDLEIGRNVHTVEEAHYATSEQNLVSGITKSAGSLGNLSLTLTVDKSASRQISQSNDSKNAMSSSSTASASNQKDKNKDEDFLSSHTKSKMFSAIFNETIHPRLDADIACGQRNDEQSGGEDDFEPDPDRVVQVPPDDQGFKITVTNDIPVCSKFQWISKEQLIKDSIHGKHNSPLSLKDVYLINAVSAVVHKSLPQTGTHHRTISSGQQSDDSETLDNRGRNGDTSLDDENVLNNFEEETFKLEKSPDKYEYLAERQERPENESGIVKSEMERILNMVKFQLEESNDGTSVSSLSSSQTSFKSLSASQNSQDNFEKVLSDQLNSISQGLDLLMQCNSNSLSFISPDEGKELNNVIENTMKTLEASMQEQSADSDKKESSESKTSEAETTKDKSRLQKRPDVKNQSPSSKESSPKVHFDSNTTSVSEVNTNQPTDETAFWSKILGFSSQENKILPTFSTPPKKEEKLNKDSEESELKENVIIISDSPDSNQKGKNAEAGSSEKLEDSTIMIMDSSPESNQKDGSSGHKGLENRIRDKDNDGTEESLSSEVEGLSSEMSTVSPARVENDKEVPKVRKAFISPIRFPDQTENTKNKELKNDENTTTSRNIIDDNNNAKTSNNIETNSKIKNESETKNKVPEIKIEPANAESKKVEQNVTIKLEKAPLLNLGLTDASRLREKTPPIGVSMSTKRVSPQEKTLTVIIPENKKKLTAQRQSPTVSVKTETKRNDSPRHSPALRNEEENVRGVSPVTETRTVQFKSIEKKDVFSRLSPQIRDEEKKEKSVSLGSEVETTLPDQEEVQSTIKVEKAAETQAGKDDMVVVTVNKENPRSSKSRSRSPVTRGIPSSYKPPPSSANAEPMSKAGPIRNEVKAKRDERQYHPYRKEKAKKKNTWSFDIAYDSLRELMHDLTVCSYKKQKHKARHRRTNSRFANYTFVRSKVPDSLPGGISNADEEVIDDDFNENAIPDFEERKRKADLVDELTMREQEEGDYTTERAVYIMEEQEQPDQEEEKNEEAEKKRIPKMLANLPVRTVTTSSPGIPGKECKPDISKMDTKPVLTDVRRSDTRSIIFKSEGSSEMRKVETVEKTPSEDDRADDSDPKINSDEEIKSEIKEQVSNKEEKLNSTMLEIKSETMEVEDNDSENFRVNFVNSYNEAPDDEGETEMEGFNDWIVIDEAPDIEELDVISEVPADARENTADVLIDVGENTADVPTVVEEKDTDIPTDVGEVPIDVGKKDADFKQICESSANCSVDIDHDITIDSKEKFDMLCIKYTTEQTNAHNVEERIYPDINDSEACSENSRGNQSRTTDLNTSLNRTVSDVQDMSISEDEAISKQNKENDQYIPVIHLLGVKGNTFWCKNKSSVGNEKEVLSKDGGYTNDTMEVKECVAISPVKFKSPDDFKKIEEKVPPISEKYDPKGKDFGNCEDNCITENLSDCDNRVNEDELPAKPEKGENGQNQIEVEPTAKPAKGENGQSQIEGEPTAKPEKGENSQNQREDEPTEKGENGQNQGEGEPTTKPAKEENGQSQIEGDLKNESRKEEMVNSVLALPLSVSTNPAKSASETSKTEEHTCMFTETENENKYTYCEKLASSNVHIRDSKTEINNVCNGHAENNMLENVKNMVDSGDESENPVPSNLHTTEMDSLPIEDAETNILENVKEIVNSRDGSEEKSRLFTANVRNNADNSRSEEKLEQDKEYLNSDSKVNRESETNSSMFNITSTPNKITIFSQPGSSGSSNNIQDLANISVLSESYNEKGDGLSLLIGAYDQSSGGESYNSSTDFPQDQNVSLSNNTQASDCCHDGVGSDKVLEAEEKMEKYDEVKLEKKDDSGLHFPATVQNTLDIVSNNETSKTTFDEEKKQVDHAPNTVLVDKKMELNYDIENPREADSSFDAEQQFEDIMSVIGETDHDIYQEMDVEKSDQMRMLKFSSSECGLCDDQLCLAKVKCLTGLLDPLEEAMLSSGILDINDVPVGNVVEIGTDESFVNSINLLQPNNTISIENGEPKMLHPIECKGTFSEEGGMIQRSCVNVPETKASNLNNNNFNSDDEDCENRLVINDETEETLNESVITIEDDSESDHTSSTETDYISDSVDSENELSTRGDDMSKLVVSEYLRTSHKNGSIDCLISVPQKMENRVDSLHKSHSEKILESIWHNTPEKSSRLYNTTGSLTKSSINSNTPLEIKEETRSKTSKIRNQSLVKPLIVENKDTPLPIPVRCPSPSLCSVPLMNQLMLSNISLPSQQCAMLPSQQVPLNPIPLLYAIPQFQPFSNISSTLPTLPLLPFPNISVVPQVNPFMPIQSLSAFSPAPAFELTNDKFEAFRRMNNSGRAESRFQSPILGSLPMFGSRNVAQSPVHYPSLTQRPSQILFNRNVTPERTTVIENERTTPDFLQKEQSPLLPPISSFTQRKVAEIDCAKSTCVSPSFPSYTGNMAPSHLNHPVRLPYSCSSSSSLIPTHDFPRSSAQKSYLPDYVNSSVNMALHCESSTDSQKINNQRKNKDHKQTKSRKVKTKKQTNNVSENLYQGHESVQKDFMTRKDGLCSGRIPVGHVKPMSFSDRNHSDNQTD
ncbi:uncharacterized protein LOC133203560 [Saccostrea echinata]|uniref:uncharacterized protein LOC133203560 n=1 Tax=Saccostrea echinata TaxID=191078 RepID=UPI002A82751F|nr:uncharacterized protein LOC133203560 [Saccostrea echinata]